MLPSLRTAIFRGATAFATQILGAKESVASDPPGTIQTECVRLKVKGRDKNGAPFGLIA